MAAQLWVQPEALLSPQMQPLRLPRPQLLHALLQALRAAPILLHLAQHLLHALPAGHHAA